MDRSRVTLEDIYANLTIEDEEDGGMLIGEVEVQQKTDSFVLVGKFLTEKNINFGAMQNVLAALWRPNEGVEIHDIGGHRYSFVFYHIMDVNKVMEGGPWSFEQNLLVFRRVSDMEDPHLVQLNESDIWVQVHDIPRGFISETILQNLGNSVGRFVKSDPANFDRMWKSFVRIRVTLNIDKPLKQRMTIKREGDTWCWINFKYERLSTFCFVCGMLRHAERDCNIVYANPEKEIQRTYGTWLRAPPRNSKMNTGARWLRNAQGGNGQWPSKHVTAGSSTTRYSGERPETRFMEIDGKLCENHGDNEMIKITPRDQGNTTQ